jgi:hypothetical protein
MEIGQTTTNEMLLNPIHGGPQIGSNILGTPRLQQRFRFDWRVHETAIAQHERMARQCQRLAVIERPIPESLDQCTHAGDLIEQRLPRHLTSEQVEAVLSAVRSDIRLDRVATCRTLFVTERAPHRPFKNGQVLNMILRDAFARTGLKPPVPYVGSHILRHSLATNLVQRGASLEEIADVLRHRSRGSTMVYAKVDIAGLRSIAQPWPTPGGAQ